MTVNRKEGAGRSGFPWRIVGWGGAAVVLLLPLIANLPWTLSDYFIMGILLGGAGLLLELAVRASGSHAYRFGAGTAVVAAFLLVWVNGAVGFLGNEDNPANLLFFGVILIAVAGSALADFRPVGMAWTMLATALAQLSVGALALAAGLGSPGHDGIYEVVMGTSLFGGLWLFSAGLFRRAARQQAGPQASL